MGQSSFSTPSDAVASLVWVAGVLPDTSEAAVPPGVEPFALANELRRLDASAAYAVDERALGFCVIVAMPDEPPAEPEPAKSSEPKVYMTKVSVWATVSPILKAEYFLYGPSVAYLESLGRRISNIARRVITVVHSPIEPVDYGPDDDGSSGGWEDDESGLIATVNAVGTIVKHLHRVYPKDVPTNDELSKEMVAAFKDVTGGESNG